MNQTNLQLEQLKNYQLWRKANGEAFTLLDYLYGVANIELAIAFTALFWPEFTEHKGGVFFAIGFSEQLYDQWHEALKGDLVGIEQVMNHRHVADLLPGSENTSSENVLYLGQKIAEMWESRLARLYPKRRFSVRCYRDEDSDVEITFTQLTSE